MSLKPVQAVRRCAAHRSRCPDRHAQVIAEHVDAAWSGNHGSCHLELPLSVVAALSLLSEQAMTADDMTTGILSLRTDEFAELIGELWLSFARSRPDLTIRAWPLMSVWHDPDQPLTEEQRCAAHSVGIAALRAGILALTATDRRYETDLLGTLLTRLRPRVVLQDRGQFLTPPAPCALIAQVLGDADRPVVFDPAAGTAGMLRTQAQRMRAAGQDPAQVRWIAADTDPTAIACAAVNTVVWGLGELVVLGVGDTLAGDQWWTRAIAEREETLQLVRSTRLFAAVRHGPRDRPVVSTTPARPGAATPAPRRG